MSRTITAATLAKAQASQSEVVHLLKLAFSGGTVYLTTGPHDVSWDGHTWSAAGGAMAFEAVPETADASGQRLKIILDGVALTAIAALLSEDYIGRLGTLYRAHIDSAGLIVADPMVLFLGYMNSPWDISEDWENHWCKVETELVSPLAVLDQVRGITADPNSHQAFFSADTFFSHISTKVNEFAWGVFEKVPHA